MDQLLALLASLAIWAHPTNVISPHNYGWIVFGTGPSVGICHVADGSLREVGRCFGVEEPTAASFFYLEEKYPSPIKHQLVIPGIAR